MNYIRTHDGIYEVEKKQRAYFEGQPWLYYCKGRSSSIEEKDILKQADAIDELIDELIDMVDGKPVIESDENCVFLSCKKMLGEIKDIFGAIWVIGENNEPILRSVAKENEEGKLELLCVEEVEK